MVIVTVVFSVGDINYNDDDFASEDSSLVIDESANAPMSSDPLPTADADRVVSDAIHAVAEAVEEVTSVLGRRIEAAGASEPVSTRTRSKTRPVTVFTGVVGDDDDDDDEDCVPVVSRGRPTKRSGPTSGYGVAKRSRSQSRGSRSPSRESITHCAPVDRPPPPRITNPDEAEAQLAKYMQDIALLHKEYRSKHLDHGCFGRRSKSMREIHCVYRGKTPKSFLQYWAKRDRRLTIGPDGVPNGFYDSDPAYYSDPESLNPRKGGKLDGVRVTGDDYGSSVAGPSGLKSSSSTDGGPPIVATFRAVTGPHSRGSMTVTVDNTPVVAEYDADADAIDIHANEADLDPVRTTILRRSRSFESRFGDGLLTVNIGGVRTHILDDKDEETGELEDRRGPYTINKRERQAAAEEAEMEMTDEEFEEFDDARKAAKEKKRQTKLRKQAVALDRLTSTNEHNVYCGDPNTTSCTTGEGLDTYIGTQGPDMALASDMMTLAILDKADHDETTTAPSWQATVDTVGERDKPSNFSEADSLSLEDDISLVRAKDNKIINGLWTYAMTQASKHAEAIASQKVKLDRPQLKKWIDQITSELPHRPQPVVYCESGPVKPNTDLLTEDQLIPSDGSTLDETSSIETASSASDSDDDDDANVPSATTTTTTTNVVTAADNGDDANVAPVGPVATDGAASGEDDELDRPDLNKSIPWDQYVASPVREVEAEAEAAGLRPSDRAAVRFLTNLEGRMIRFQETGEVDQVLIDQLTMG